MVDTRDFTDSYKRRKLLNLAEAEGFASIQEMLKHYVYDSVVPAICARSSCDCTSMMEPDQHEGWCECCDTSSMASAFVWAELI